MEIDKENQVSIINDEEIKKVLKAFKLYSNGPVPV